MAILLSVDPGVCSGWAVFNGSELVACGVATEPPSAIELSHFDQVVIECPVIYPGGRTRDPNALIKVALSAGQWAGATAVGESHNATTLTYIKPRTWKGTIDPEVCCKRVYARLTAQEKALVDQVKVAASKRHNLLDAVGIGLYALKR